MRREALRGRFRDHHATMLRLVHEHVVHLEASIEKLDVEVDRVIAPLRLLVIGSIRSRASANEQRNASSPRSVSI